MRRRFGILAVISATLAALAVGGISVLSASAQPAEKVTICHRRAAVNNPYGPKAITVNQNSINNPNGHATHTGPIFPATGPDGKWGDIIPPIPGYPGQNFTAEGQAILANDCQIPGVTPPTQPTQPPTQPTQPTQPPGPGAAPSVPVPAPVVGQPVFTG
jgi:hypothetical protein